MFFTLGNFIQACNALGQYGLILEFDKEIYQELLEPLFKELKVGDDTSLNPHNTNSNLTSPKKAKVELDYE